MWSILRYLLCTMVVLHVLRIRTYSCMDRGIREDTTALLHYMYYMYYMYYLHVLAVFAVNTHQHRPFLFSSPALFSPFSPLSHILPLPSTPFLPPPSPLDHILGHRVYCLHCVPRRINIGRARRRRSLGHTSAHILFVPHGIHSHGQV